MAQESATILHVMDLAEAHKRALEHLLEQTTPYFPDPEHRQRARSERAGSFAGV